jgi:hypothetical protein
MARKNKKMPSSKSSVSKKPGLEATVISAIIVTVGTILVAFLAFPPFVNLLNSKWNPTPIPTATATITPPPNGTTSSPTETPFNPFYTESAPPSPISIATEALLPTSTFTVPSPTVITQSEVMRPELTASSNSIKSGGKVNFNARNSSVIFTDGTIYTCVNYRLCSFAWTIYHQDTGTRTVIVNDGSFTHAFSKKGKYTVTINVCRGESCGFTSTIIEVR